MYLAVFALVDRTTRPVAILSTHARRRGPRSIRGDVSYNISRPHSSLGGRAPVPETIVFPGFSLADYGPPLTREVAVGLI